MLDFVKVCGVALLLSEGLPLSVWTVLYVFGLLP